MIITLQTLIFFRESFLNALDRLLRPYYNRLSLVFGRNGEPSDDEDSDEQVFAEFDEERGVVFYPAMYLQRYAAVSDCLIDGQWREKLEKVGFKRSVSLIGIDNNNAYNDVVPNGSTFIAGGRPWLP